LKSHLDIFVDKLNHEQLSDKSSEITSLIIRNTTNPTSNQFEVLSAIAIFQYLIRTCLVKRIYVFSRLFINFLKCYHHCAHLQWCMWRKIF